MKTKQKISVLFLLVLSMAFAFLVSFIFYYWAGYPRGVEAAAHSIKAFWILEFFPHHNWWNVWASGMPLFIFYPPSSSLIIAILARLLTITPELSMSIVTVATVGVTGFFVAMIVYDQTKNFAASLVSAFITISCPAPWFYSIAAGGYSRAISLMFIPMAMYFAIVISREVNSRKALAGLVISLVLGFYFHTLMGLVASGLALVLIVMLVTGNIRSRLRLLVRVFVWVAVLSAFYFLPLKYYTVSSNYDVGLGSFDLKLAGIVPWQNIVGIFNLLPTTDSYFIFTNLSPFVVLLPVIFLIIVFLFSKKLPQDRLVWILLIGIAGSVLFCIARIPILLLAYVMISAEGGLFFTTIFGAVLIGILMTKINPRYTQLICSVTGMLLLLWLVLSFHLNINKLAAAVWPRPVAGEATSTIVDEIKPPRDVSQYRFGDSTESILAMGFNRIYPRYSQTRDYFATGNLNNDFSFYFTNAIWRWSNNPQETKFLIDWWSVDQFVTNRNFGYTDLNKFANADYKLSYFGGFNLYQVNQPSPMLTATNTRSLLFVGPAQDYQLLFQALAQGNVNSSQIIPVWSTLQTADLTKFSAVLIYNPTNVDESSWVKIKDYVKAGGALLIDGPRDNSANLSDVFPVTKISKSQVKDQWNLVSVDKSLTTDFSKFAPPIYQDGPWGIGIADGLSSWAKILVTENNQPVVVGGSLGQGKVLWSGLNTVYHVISFKNSAESQFLKQEIAWLTGDQILPLPAYDAQAANPETRRITLYSPATGVLFKENYFPAWKAVDNGQEVPIYKAGPNFMYVPLLGAKAGDRIDFVYGITPIEVLGYLISIGGLFGLVVYLFVPSVASFFALKFGSLSFFTGQKLNKWWERDEE